jgi:hypothetical protein
MLLRPGAGYSGLPTPEPVSPPCRHSLCAGMHTAFDGMQRWVKPFYVTAFVPLDMPAEGSSTH